MGDIMRQIPIANLLDWVLTEHQERGTIFGIKDLYKSNPERTIPLFKEKMETPFGPAAGPQTQLAQNLIASYVAGARFFEVKTVQIIDGEDLPVSKPCINAADECYNVEWSTELRVPQAFEEYTKAWFVLKLISKEFGLGGSDGFIFNMSVGYDLAGIQSEKVDTYINHMKEAKDTQVWKDCVAAAKACLGSFKNVDEAYIDGISSKVCDSITISTLHGCPPDEIERIATYLIEEKGLNTFIKCNPTMLGYEFARKTMDDLAFDYVTFDDHHFKEDLQFEDAVPMLTRLQKKCDEKGLTFGVKLTNTFPVDVAHKELPGEEMYMSGRSLFPLSIALAKRLSDAFDGKLQISYSGGADAFNIVDIYNTGVWPITLATSLLKPGGYQRMTQLAKQFEKVEYHPFHGVDRKKLDQLVERSKKSALYRKPIKEMPSPKMKATVPLIDCFKAPCTDGCPINQDIPAYLRLTEEGKYQEALEVIVEKNPLPYMTGTLCTHRCTDKCTRQFYEENVRIREVKLEAANHAYDDFVDTLGKPKETLENKKTAVIGGGPAGIAMAHFLARAGVPVTVFEKRDTMGGIPRHVIPKFRMDAADMEKDVEMARRLGAEFVTGQDAPSVEELRAKGYENVVIAIGAWSPGRLPLQEGEAINAIRFLSDCHDHSGENPYGKRIVVIGGGNTAMDVARAARHLPGIEEVSLVYRRDERNMPAEEEELQFALEDGAVFRTLLSPIRYVDGVLTCEQMKLGPVDASGQRSPVGTGQMVEIEADALVAAVGEQIDREFLERSGLSVNERNRLVQNSDTLETNQKGVYAIGDVSRGPATIVEAIADAAKVAKAICGLDNSRFEPLNQDPHEESPRSRRGILELGLDGPKEGARCLSCSTICESCVDVCPNRANEVVNVNGKPQIIHVDGMCNECGNCETFCPYSSAPYKDKFTLFSSQEDFDNSENAGFLVLDENTCKVRYLGKVQDVSLNGEGAVPAGLVDLMKTTIEKYPYYIYTY